MWLVEGIRSLNARFSQTLAAYLTSAALATTLGAGSPAMSGPGCAKALAFSPPRCDAS